jgi:hypothetical protein
MKTTTTLKTPMRLTMRSAVLAAALVMGGAAGCDKKSEPAKTNVPKPPAPDVTPKATSGGTSSSASASSAGAGVKSSPATAPTAAQAPSSASKPSGPIVVDAPLVTSTESARHSKEAQDLVGKAMQEIKDKKFDDAKAALDKVDAMGDDVPRETRELAKTVRKSLDSARKLQQAPEIPADEGPNK